MKEHKESRANKQLQELLTGSGINMAKGRVGYVTHALSHSQQDPVSRSDA